MLDLLLLKGIVGSPMIQVMTQTADEHSQHFQVAERALHLATLTPQKRVKTRPQEHLLFYL